MPIVTGIWNSLPQASFDELAPDGGPLHFRNQFSDAGQTNPIFYRNPITNVSTGQTARQVISAQAATFGWPLVGIFISGSGNVPHFALHSSLWPVQTGSQAQRAEKLQNDLLLYFENIYKSSNQIIDPTDPDFGQTIDVRNFWGGVKCWNYQSNNLLYVPRTTPGVGDFAFIVSDDSPPATWFQWLN